MLKKYRSLKVLVLTTVLSFSLNSTAQDFSADFMSSPGKYKNKINLKQSYDFLFQSNGDSEESKKNASKQFDGSLSIPVYQLDKTTLALTAKAQALNFNDVTNTTNVKTVYNLYDYQYGITWATEEENKNTWSAQLSYGSASDKPFDSSDVSTFGATLTRKSVIDENSSWLFLLNYSNNRSFLNGIPLPGVAYSFTNAEKTNGGVLGIPFISYWYRPDQKIFASVFYLFPITLKAQAGYLFFGFVQGNLKFESSQQAYLLTNRANLDQRFFYDTKKIATSAKMFFGPFRNFEIELARVFDRTIYEGKSSFSIESDHLSLPAEWQISLSTQLAF